MSPLGPTSCPTPGGTEPGQRAPQAPGASSRVCVWRSPCGGTPPCTHVSAARSSSTEAENGWHSGQRRPPGAHPALTSSAQAEDPAVSSSCGFWNRARLPSGEHSRPQLGGPGPAAGTQRQHTHRQSTSTGTSSLGKQREPLWGGRDGWGESDTVHPRGPTPRGRGQPPSLQLPRPGPHNTSLEFSSKFDPKRPPLPNPMN